MRINAWLVVVILAGILLGGLVGYAMSQTSSHGLRLSWTNPAQLPQPSQQYVGNNVYRKLAGETNYTRIYQSTGPIVQYDDPVTGTLQGKQACYAVSIFDNLGQESAMALQTNPCQFFPLPPGAAFNVQSIPY